MCNSFKDTYTDSLRLQALMLGKVVNQQEGATTICSLLPPVDFSSATMLWNITPGQYYKSKVSNYGVHWDNNSFTVFSEI